MAAQSRINVQGKTEKKEGWEDTEFPILCETCLGPNPYVRMARETFGKECKICSRPFTCFRWKPGREARYKKTEVCQTCAKMKNVCQTCLLDLQFALPVQVRDQFLPEAERIDVPQGNVNMEWMRHQVEHRIKNNDMPYGKMHVNPELLRLARVSPYYKRNAPHVCSFFIKGECTRGAECPFRHELPESGEMAEQNIKDRYHGVNDPVAEKLVHEKDAPHAVDPQPSVDPSLTTLFVGNVDTNRIGEADILFAFHKCEDDVQSVRLAPRVRAAFVTFRTHGGAAQALEKLCNKLEIRGSKLRLAWGHPQGEQPKGLPCPVQRDPGVVSHESTPPASLPSSSTTPGVPSSGSIPVVVPMGRPYYPSMDPHYRGSAPR